MTVKETLIAARKLIEDPENWKQGGIASGIRENEIVGPFCSMGAIKKAGGILAHGWGSPSRTGGVVQQVLVAEENLHNEEAQRTCAEAEGILAECLPEAIHEYNDSHGHTCVLAAFDEAIKRAEANEVVAAA